MKSSPFRWLIDNLGALLLAFVMSVVVWISAVTAADPNVDRIRNVPIEIMGLDADMLIVGNVPSQARVSLRAPRSISDRLAITDNAVRAWVDVAGLEAGTHTLEVNTHINENFQPVKQIQVNPVTITITLEPLATRTVMVKLEVSGEPAVGYQKGVAARNPTSVTISGPESLVSRVDRVRAILNISDASETVSADVPVQALDADGRYVSGVTLTPNQITVTQPISLLGGYRNVVVKVVTTGQVAEGFKLTNISVSPPNVVVFSTDPQLVNNLPSFVETAPLDLTGAEDDIDILLDLDLPEGISVVGNQSVLVQVSIAAVEGSIRIAAPVVILGLSPLHVAEVSPNNLELILSGPMYLLNQVSPKDLRVVVDLTGLQVGSYQLAPVVDILPERLTVESIMPSILDVTIAEAPTPTPTITPTPAPGG